MAVNKDQSLLAISGYHSADNGDHFNTVYLFSISIVENKFNLTLLDTIEASKGSSMGQKKEDIITGLIFVESLNSSRLLTLTRNSAKLGLIGVENNSLRHLIDEIDFSGTHSLGNCNLFKNQSLNDQSCQKLEFFIASNTDNITRLRLRI